MNRLVRCFTFKTFVSSFILSVVLFITTGSIVWIYFMQDFKGLEFLSFDIMELIPFCIISFYNFVITKRVNLKNKNIILILSTLWLLLLWLLFGLTCSVGVMVGVIKNISLDVQLWYIILTLVLPKNFLGVLALCIYNVLWFKVANKRIQVKTTDTSRSPSEL